MAAGHPRGPTKVDTVPKGVKDAAEGMGRDRGAAIGSLEEVGVTERPIGRHGDCEIKYSDPHITKSAYKMRLCETSIQFILCGPQ